MNSQILFHRGLISFEVFAVQLLFTTTGNKACSITCPVSTYLPTFAVMIRSNRNPANGISIPNILLKTILKKDGRRLNICHVNGGAVFIKIDELRRIFEDSDVHIIVLSETWLKSYRSNASISIEGFYVLRNDRQRVRSGGVAIYVKKGLNAKVVKASNNIKSEYLFVEIIFPNSKILIGAYYKAPKIDEICQIDDVLSELLWKYADVIIMGDFNENLLRRDPNGNCVICRSRCCSTCRFVNCLDKHGLESIGSAPTNFDQTPSLIDLMLTNQPTKVTIFNQISTGLSNHDLLLASYAVPEDFTSSKPNLWRNYRAINTVELATDLRNSNVNRVFECTDVGVMIESFNETLVKLLDKHAPIKPFLPKNGLNSTKNWYTKEISIATVNQEIAKRAYKASKTPANLDEYRKLRNIATQLVKNAKKDFLRPHLDRKVGMKRMWKNASDLGLISGRKSVMSPAFTADEFNKHTTTVSGEDAALTAQSSLNPTQTLPPVRTPGSGTLLAFRTVTQLEVLDATKTIKTKAIGLDGIPLTFIKLILVDILPHVTHIINCCITTSKCPSVWKRAKVLPSHKKSKTYELDDFRGISILPVFSKVFETLIKNQIMEHLNLNSLIAHRQSGFRSMHSTTTALLKISDDIKRALDKKMIAVLILLDFTKAFDSVVHKLLCDKLQLQFSFDESAVNLIMDYLSGRMQAVSIDGVMSDYLPVNRGLPQGSVLGPILFLLFINDMPTTVRFMSTHLFADDVQLYRVFAKTNLAANVLIMNRDMAEVNEWATSNKLKLNAKKSQGIVITNNPVDFSPLIRLNEVPIPFFSKVKNLGLIVNNEFKWLHHVEQVTNKVYAGLRSLLPFSRSTPLKTRELLAKSLLMPHFEYCCTVFAYGLDYGTKVLLNNAFNAVIRYVYGLNRQADVEDFAVRFVGYSLFNFLKFRCMSFLFKLIRTKSPRYLSDLIEIDYSSRTKQASIPRCNAMLRNTLFGKGLVDWNRLPVAVRFSSSYGMFCNRYPA